MTKEEIDKEDKERELYLNEPGKLSMLTFDKKLPFNINRGLSGFEVIDLSGGRDWTVDLNVYLPTKKMNLQRSLVWTLQQKQELIFSILKKLNIPPITIIQFRDDQQKITLQVIDGKQRITTLISFYRGEFSIPFGGKNWFWNDLTRYAQHRINDCLKVDVGYEYEDKRITDDDKIIWFEMINFAGTPQDLDHLNNLKK